jgi:hypothetical protein
MGLSGGRAEHPFVPVKEELRQVDLNGFCPECHNVATAWGKVLAKVEAERDRYRDALLKIRNELGGVCEMFEICEHRACRDSYAAREIANEALNPTEEA